MKEKGLQKPGWQDALRVVIRTSKDYYRYLKPFPIFHEKSEKGCHYTLSAPGIISTGDEYD
jgi:hypothetical protein